MDTRFVRFEDVVGVWAQEYGTPIITFDNLIILGRRAVKALHIDENNISFDMMCQYIIKYIQTPFGQKVLKELANS